MAPEQADAASKGILERLRQKIETLIVDQLEPGEDLQTWVNGQTSPAEWMSILPILSTIHKLKTKHWIITLTDQRLLLIQHGAMSPTRVLEVVSIPLAEIRGLSMQKGVLFVALLVNTKSGIWKFKEMEKEEVLPFIEEFKSAKVASRKHA